MGEAAAAFVRAEYSWEREERDIVAGFFEIAVARHDIQHDARWLRVGRRRHEQGLCRRREAGDRRRGSIHSAAGDGGLEGGAKIQRG